MLANSWTNYSHRIIARRVVARIKPRDPPLGMPQDLTIPPFAKQMGDQNGLPCMPVVRLELKHTHCFIQDTTAKYSNFPHI